MKKKVLLIPVALLLAISLIAAGCPAPPPEEKAPPPPPPPEEEALPPPIALKYTTHAPEVIMAAQVLKSVMGEIETRSEGRIKPEIFWGSTMASPMEAASFVAEGIAQGGSIDPLNAPALLPLSRGVELVYLSEKPDALYKAIRELYSTYPPFAEEWEKQGLKPLFYSISEMIPIPSKKPAYKWEDMKGWQIRASGIDANLVSRWGANPVNIPFGEIYEALERGLLDSSTAIFFSSFFGLRMFEVTDYAIDTGAGLVIVVFESVSLDWYNSLPKDLQAVIDNVSNDSFEIWSQTMIGGTTFIAQELAKTDMTFIQWSAEEKQRAKEQALPEVHNVWYDEMEEKGLGPEAHELIERLTALIAKYEPESAFPYPFGLVEQARQ